MAIKVSVIMAARNVETYIQEAIQSVLNQKGIHFELLIGEDASTDNTKEKIKIFVNDSRVRIWYFRRRRHPAAIRNFLIERARGAYISVCDADDRLLPGNLVFLSRLLDRNPSVGVVCPAWRFMDLQGCWLSQRKGVIPLNKTWDLFRAGWTHGGSMIRRRDLKQIGGYSEKRLLSEDHDLLMRLSEITQFKMVEKELYAYRQHPYPRNVRQKIIELERQSVRDAIYRRYRFKVPW